MMRIQLEDVKSSLTKSFRLMEGMSPRDDGDGDFEEALWQLGKVADSLAFMKASYEEIIYEAKTILTALEEIGKVVQEKRENPYRQVEFVSFQEISRHAHP